MRRLAFEVISQSETKSGILVKLNKPKKRGGGSPNFVFDWNPYIFGI
jgi:hypothetical protein